MKLDLSVVAPRKALDRARPFSQNDIHVVQKEPAYEVPPGLLELAHAMRAYVDTQSVPANFHEKWVSTTTQDPNGTLLDEGVGFPIHSVLCDNLTSLWLRAEPGQRAIPPYTVGVIVPSPVGKQHATVRSVLPPGLVNATAVAGQLAWFGFSEAFLPPSPGVTVPALGATTLQVQGQAIGLTTSVYGTVVAPAANAAITGTGNLPAGNYELTAYAWYGSTADVADNMKLVISGVSTLRTLVVPPAVNGTPVPQTILRVNITAPASFQVQAIAGGAAGSVYKAALDVTPVA